MHLMDTAGQEDYAELRVLGHAKTNCFIVCFSVADKVTFNNLENVWLPEIRRAEPAAKILLVGTKADLRGQTGHTTFAGSMRNQEVCTQFYVLM